MLPRRRTSRHISTQRRITQGVPGMTVEMIVATTARASSVMDAEVIAAAADDGAGAADVIMVAVNKAVPAGEISRRPNMRRRRAATTTIAGSSAAMTTAV